MSYQDTLVPGRVVDLSKCKPGTNWVNHRPHKVSRERALECVGSMLAWRVWNMIEPIIQGKTDLTALLYEQYPFYVGVAEELGVYDKMMSTLGILAHDAPKNVRL